MENIKIGTIVNAVGLKGEVKVYNYSDYKERYEELDTILVQSKKTLNEYKIKGVRYQKNMVILKLEGVDDRNAAEALKEKDIYITEDDLRQLPEDTFYIRDLIGCIAVDYNDESPIGEIVDVLQNTAQDIYQIKMADGKQVLIPAVAQFVKEVNIEDKKVKLSLIPGFLD